MIRSAILAAAAAFVAIPAWAEITVTDPYARASGMMATAGAAFMTIENSGDTDMHLIDARADVSEKVELHTHKEDENGVMRMLHVEEGFIIPAEGTLELARGGNHVMFLGLKEAMEQGEIIPLTLVFEGGEEVTVEVPVDLERQPDHGAMGHMDHSGHKGHMDHSGHMGHGDAMPKEGMSAQ